jgi:phospholipase D3/4
MGFLLFLFVSATALGQFIELVETVPVSMNITSVGRSVADAWVAMFASAQKTIDMTSLYVVLSSGFGRGSEKGKEVLNALVAAIKRGVVVRVMVPWPSLSNKAGLDLDFLSSQGALIGKFNWTRIVGSSGMLHAKYLVVDSKHFYSGSADFSWSALARIKQLGVVAWDSPVLAADALRVFNQ